MSGQGSFVRTTNLSAGEAFAASNRVGEFTFARIRGLRGFFWGVVPRAVPGLLSGRPGGASEWEW